MRYITEFDENYVYIDDPEKVKKLLKELDIRGPYSALMIKEESDYTEIWGSVYDYAYYRLVYVN
jgi:hypothetical protein